MSSALRGGRSMLLLRTLGALALVGPDGPLLVGRRKELSILAYLARRSPRRVSRAELATLLWGDRDEARARHSLRQVLVQLTRVVDALEVKPDYVSLTGGVELDVTRFERDVAEGRAAEGVAAWHGEFLADAEDAGGEEWRLWVEGERVALRVRLARAMEALVAGAEARGEWDDGVARATRWTELLPYDERAQQRLLEMLRLSGRGGDGAARYETFASRLQADVGRTPSPELQRLASQLGRTAHTSARLTAGPGSAALFTADLVGRGPAYAELVSAWESVGAGARVVVLVEGDEGMGKTRLCTELLRWIASRGADRALVLRPPRAVSGEQRPLGAIVDMLAPIGDAPGLLGAPPGALLDASAIIPAIRTACPQLGAAAGSPHRTAAAVARVLADVSAEQPIVLVVDDFPIIDLESRALLVSVARELSLVEEGRVLLLITARTGDECGTLAELRGMRISRRVPLQPLTRTNIEALIESMLPIEVESRAHLAERLSGETGGNPFYVIELVSELLDEGYLEQDAAGTWRLVSELSGGPLPLPVDLRAAIIRRLDRLTPAGRLLLSRAAAHGSWSGAVGLANGGVADGSVAAALDEVVSRRLLREAPAGSGRYEFAHDLVRRVASESLPPANGMAEFPPDTAGRGGAMAGRAVGRAWLRRGAFAGAVIVGAIVVVVATRRSASGTIDTERSIAVLPFERTSAEPGTEYFTAGLTDELTNALGAVPHLRVAARTSVAALSGQHLDARALAQKLGVQTLLEGSISTSGGRARVVAQLVDGRTGYELWAGRYDRPMSDALGLQEELTGTILGALRLQLGDSAGSTRREDPRAHDLFLRGRYLWGLRGESNFRRAIGYFEKAVAADSGYARAWAGLADAEISLADRGIEPAAMYASAKRAAERAVSLDASLAEPHIALGRIAVYEWEWATAERETHRAVELAPNDGDARHLYSHALMYLGRMREAGEEQSRMLAADPFGPQTSFHPCWQWYELRQYDRALQACRTALELHPNQPESHTKLGFVYWSKRMYDSAVVAFAREEEISPGVPEAIANHAMALASAGRGDDARRKLAELERRIGIMRLPPLDVACAWLALSDRERALSALERGAEGRRRDPGFARGHRDLVYLPFEPCVDELRGEPRFKRVLSGLGLP